MVNGFLAFTLLLVIPQDPRMAEFGELLEKEKAARKAGNVEKADRFRKEIVEKFEKEFLDPQRNELAESVIGKFLPRVIELFSADEETRKKRRADVDEALEAEFKALGIPDGIRSLLPPAPDGEVEAARLLKQAKESSEKALEGIPRLKELQEEDIEEFYEALKDESQARAYLDAHGPTLDLLGRALRHGRARFSTENYEQGWGADLLAVEAVSLANLLNRCAAARRTLSDGKGALEACLLQVKLASAVKDEPFLTSALSCSVAVAVAVRTLEETALRERPGAEWIRSCESRLADIDPRRLLTRALRGEALQARGATEELLMFEVRKVGFFEEEVLTLFREDMLVLVRKLRADWKWAKERFPTRLEDGPKDGDSMPIMTSIMYPSVQRAYDSFVRLEATVRVARLALAAMNYERMNGRIPEALGQLSPGFIREIPDDPFTGKSLQYRQGRIYSVGENGKDDGGTDRDPGTDDIGFRLK